MDAVLKSKLPPHSRLVDVQKMQLEAGEQAGEFAALSYVWGNCKNKKLYTTTRNVGERQQIGGLGRVRYPKTIADAINLTKDLEIRYLWIDALCIIQDGDNLEDQIQTMDRMFGLTSLVLVAAAGVDQEAGLTGYRDTPRTRTDQRIANVQGLRVVVSAPSLNHVLQNSKWNTRAWTFQEWQFARRALISTDEQVY